MKIFSGAGAIKQPEDKDVSSAHFGAGASRNTEEVEINDDLDESIWESHGKEDIKK